MNRPSGLDRLTMPSGSFRRGASGLYVPDLSLPDANPYPGCLQGLDVGKSWSNVRLVSNRLHGTVINGGPPFDDAVMAFPVTCGRDVRITASIYRVGNNDAASSQEIELQLCVELSPFYCTLYEVMIAVHGTDRYTEIVRWRGPIGGTIDDFTFLDIELTSPVVANGDVFRATKAGNTITAELNQGSGFTTLASADITSAPANAYGPSVYNGGLPGVGFWQRGGVSANLLDFGLYNIQIETA